jgi:hypothetical protein
MVRMRKVIPIMIHSMKRKLVRARAREAERKARIVRARAKGRRGDRDRRRRRMTRKEIVVVKRVEARGLQ